MSSAQFLKDKAREISYALIKVAYYVKRSELRNKLEFLAIDLLDNTARVSADKEWADLNKTLMIISSLDSLIRLSHSIYEIEPVNATILVRELDNLNSAIRQFGNPLHDEEQLPNIESLFSLPAVLPTNTEIANIKSNKSSTEDDVRKSIDGINFNGGSDNKANTLNTRENNINSTVNSGSIRQSAIIGIIKSGNQAGCRLKDLINAFPDVSERTLRYDLQRLCEQGVVERMGNGGPASYYAIKSHSNGNIDNKRMGVMN